MFRVFKALFFFFFRFSFFLVFFSLPSPSSWKRFWLLGDFDTRYNTTDINEHNGYLRKNNKIKFWDISRFFFPLSPHFSSFFALFFSVARVYSLALLLFPLLVLPQSYSAISQYSFICPDERKWRNFVYDQFGFYFLFL